jgi:hypothetical protein
MSRVRVAVISVLLALAAVVTPAVTASTDSGRVVHAEDVGWGVEVTADESTPAPEPTETGTVPLDDVGWG